MHWPLALNIMLDQLDLSSALRLCCRRSVGENDYEGGIWEGVTF